MNQTKKILSHDGVVMLSARKVAARLDVAPDYVTKLCREGRLDGVRVRNAWYVKESSIARFEKEREAARIARSEELAAARRQEQEVFNKLNNTIFDRFAREARQTVGKPLVAASFALALFLAIGLSYVLPGTNTFFAVGSDQNAAVAQIESPFFGLQPPHLTFSWNDVLAYFFGSKQPVVAVETQTTQPVVQNTATSTTQTKSPTPVAAQTPVQTPAPVVAVEQPAKTQTKSQSQTVVNNNTYPVIERTTTVITPATTTGVTLAQLNAKIDDVYTTIARVLSGYGVQNGSSSGGGGTTIINNTTSATPAGNSGELQFNASGSFSSSASLYFDSTNTRLGIGTNNPQATLSLGTGGIIRLASDSTSASGCFAMIGNTLEYSNDCVTFQSFTASSAGGWTDGGSVVTLSSNLANVGLGTTSPYAKLTVWSQSSSSGVKAFEIVNSASTTLLSVDSAGNTTLTNLAASNVVASALTIGSFTGPLQAVNGVVSATGTLSVAYGGTGLSTAPTFGQVLVGNSAGGYTLMSTSSLGISAGAGSITAVGPANQQVSSGSVLFATSTTGSDFTITGSGQTITFNIPTAASTARGLLTSADWTTFNNKISSSSLSGGAGIAYNSATGVITNTIGYPFPNDATSTTLTFTAGLVAVGSTTINGNATTTGNLAVGSLTLNGTRFTNANLSQWINDAGYLASVIADAPLSGAGTSASHLTIAQAGSSQSGYLSSADWVLFNNKVSSSSLATAINSAFAFTPTNYGNATSTTLGFLNGFVASASSTINASTTITGTLTLGTATTTAQNGINISAGCFAVNGVCVGTSAGSLTAIGPANQQVSSGSVLFASSTTGSDFTITGSGQTITFNIPTAASTARGLLTSADWTTFNNKISSSSLSGGAGIAYNSATGVITNTIDYPFPNNATTTPLTFTSLTLTNLIGASGTTTVTGNLIPSAHNTYSLGSANYAWKDVFVGPGSLYVNGQEVIHTDASQNVIVSSDVNENLELKTSGTANVVINPSGTGQLQIAGPVQISGGKNVTTSDSSALLVPFGVAAGNITVSGNAVTATNLNGGISLTPAGNGGVYVTNGNFGIGTTSPTFALSVNGTSYLNSTLSVGGILSLLGATTTAVNGINIASGCFAVNGVCVGGGSAMGYPFALAGNATSTLTQFNGGLTAFASTTIGNNTQSGGLTILGGATTTGNAYFASTLGVGTQTPTKTFEVNGTGRFASTLTLGSVTSCAGAQALQTNASGDITCGTIATGGASSGGGWTTDNVGDITMSTTTDRVAIGATSTPYAKLTVLSGAAATTTLALIPAGGQTANIIDIYNTSGDLSTVLTAAGRFGLGSTSPAQVLSVMGNALISGNLSVANFTATGTITTALASGMVASNNGALYSTATSTLYGTGVGGQILTWSNGVPQWVASTTYTSGTGISTSFANGQLTINNTGVTSVAIPGSSLTGALTFATSTTGTDFTITNTGNTINFNLPVASATVSGKLSSTDWNTFNNKISSSSLASIFPFTPTTAFGSAANATSTLIGFTNGIYATASSTIGGGTQATGLTINGGATTTGDAYVAGYLNIASTSAIQFGGLTTLTVSSTTGNIRLGGYAGASDTYGTSSSPLSSIGARNLAIGWQAYQWATSSMDNTAVGFQAFRGGTTQSTAEYGVRNTALGSLTLYSNTTGGYNTGVGYGALNFNSTGSNNTAIGAYAGLHNSTGSYNVTIGGFAHGSNTTQNNSVVVGYGAGNAGNNTTGIGFNALFNVTGDTNTAFGYQSGFNVTSGYGNLLIGASTTPNLTTGSNNIVIGNNTFATSSTMSNALNIGGLLFGLLPATSTQFVLPTTGTFGVATSSPFAKFAVHANNGSTATTLFAIGSSTATATTTLFSVSNTGSTTIGLLGTGLVAANNGTLYSTATSTLYGNVNANTVLANATGAAGTPSFVATSTFFGTGVGGQVLAWSNGVPTWVATSTIQNGVASIALPGSTLTGALTFATSTTGTDFTITNTGNTINFNLPVASATVSGKLSSTDWNTFNNKISSSSLASIFPFTPTTAFGSAANATSTLIGFTNGIYATASSTIGGGTQATGLTINGGATTTGNAYFVGNVGIGTSNPTIPLDVAGNQRIQGSFSLILGNDQKSSIQASASTNADIKFNTNSIESARITFGGNFGVGTSSPFAKFAVHAANGNTNTSLFVIASSTQTATTTLFAVSNTGSTTISNGVNITAGCFAVNGNCLGSGTGTITAVGPAGQQVSANGVLFATSTTGSDFTITGSGQTITFNIPTASSAARGLLATTDWTAFNNKIGSTSLSATGPLNYNSTTGVFTIDVATAAQNGYLSLTDWNAFNNKVGSSSLLTTLGAWYPFGLAGNATSTLTQFNGGLTAYASSTIGSGTQSSGLTISGGATTTGNAYIGGTLGIGTQAPTKTFEVNGTGKFANTLTLGSITSCTGSQALQTNVSGDIVCGSVSAGASNSGGGWVSQGDSTNGAITQATTTYRVAIGATSTPYAQLAVISGAVGTTTLALLPATSQTANILDIYNTSGRLSSVLTAAGRFGLGSTTPAEILSVMGNGLFSGNLTAANITATGTVTVAGNFGVGTTSPMSKFAIAGGNITQVAQGSSTLAALASVVAGKHTYASYVSGNYVYSADYEGGLRILDITNPKNPIAVGSYTAANSINNVVVAGKYAYVTDFNTGLLILDVSNPAVPVLVGSYSTPSSGPTSVAVSGKYVFINDQAGVAVHVVDVSNPAAPTLAADFASGLAEPHGLAVSGKNLFITDFVGSTFIVDITNPTQPNLVGTIGSLSSPNAVSVSGRYAYIADIDSGLLVYDVSDPTTPVSVGSYHSGEQFYDVKVAGTYAYLADRKGNLSQVNISNAAAPVLIGTYNAGSTPRSVFVAGKYAYLADDANGLAIVDINGIESPAANIASLQAGNANVADNLNVGGDAYIGNGLSVGLSGIFSRGALSVLGTTTLRNFTALNATTTSFGTNSLSIGSLNGVLQAVNGLVSASTTLSVKYGGTGSTTLSGLLVGNGLGSVQTAIVSSPLTITGNTLAIQQANSSQNGYLSSTDWNTFNNKISSSSLASIFPFTPTTAFGAAANATSTLIGFLNGIYATASSTIGDGTQIGGLTINGGATTTGSAYIAGRLGIGTTSNEAVLQTGAGDVIFGGNSSTTGSFKYHYDANIVSQWFGIYDGNNQRYYGISSNLPAPAGTATVGGYYYGMGIGGATSTGGNPIFGVLNSAQTGNGIGSTALTVYANNTVHTFNNVLDNGVGRMGIGTTTPFATLSVRAPSTSTTTTLFAIASSTASVTSTLFTVSNTGSTTISLLGSGMVASNNGTLYSTATSTLYGNVNANTVLANATGAAGTPSFVATSTFFGTGVGGQVLTWNNGIPQWTATSTYTGSNGITTAFANNTLTITGTNAAADGATKGVAAFNANDFDAASGVITLDYINGQKANTSQPGFLSSADWNTFNNKVSSSSLLSSIAAAFPFTPTAYGVSTSTVVGFTNGLLSVGSTTMVGNATTTGSMYVGGINTALTFNAQGTTDTLFTLNGSTFITGSTTLPAVSLGLSNSVSGAYGTALGNANTAVAGVALGSLNTASGGAGPNSAVGYLNNATGGYSSAFGYQNTASGYLSGAFGNQNTASNNTSYAIGMSNNVSGVQSTAVGYALTNAIDNTVMIGPGDTSKLTIRNSQKFGFGTTSPYAEFGLHANNGDTNTTLFAIGSSTQTATTTLFTVSNTGSTTIALLGSGMVASNNGLLYSTASSTMFGTGTGGQILTWNNGVPQWSATSTYTGSNGITTAFANNTLTITGTNAAADGSTKGVAAFTAADFNDAAGVISIDYTNGQKATASVPGFLTAADWTTFNNKISSSSLASIFPFTPTTAFGTAANATSTLIGFTNGLYATASSTIGGGTQTTGLTISGGATTTGNAYITGSTIANGGLRVGCCNIGTATFSVYGGSSAGSGTAYGSLLRTDWTGSSNSTININGIASQALVNGTGNITAGGSMNSFNALLTHTSAGTVDLMTGYRVSRATFSSTGTTTNTRGIYIENLTSASASGSQTNTPYGIYQEGSNNLNYFAGATGFGTTSPWAQLSVHAMNGSSTTTLFAIASSTQTATTTLFSVSNTGTITTALTSGLVANNNGTLYSAATSSLFGSVAANTVLANATGGSATPTFVATSTFFGTGTGGQVLTWNAGVPQWVATSTYTGSNGITTAFANNTLTITGTNAAADGATKGVAAFTAADFNDAAGVISLDYANGQLATAGQNGFLSSTDWNTFNNKISSSSLASIFPFTPTTAFGTTANATSTLIGFTNGLYATASSTIGNGTQAGGLTINGGATTTGTAYIAGNLNIASTSAIQFGGLDVLTVSSTTGNIRLGGFAGFSDTYGTSSAPLSSIGSRNIAMGWQAFQWATSSMDNTVIGFQAFRGGSTQATAEYGVRNTAMGSLTLYSNTTGGYNTGLGYGALNHNTTGSNNTAIGAYAGIGNTTGSYNVTIGGFAHGSNTTQSNSVLVGYGAGNAGNNTTGVGFNSLFSVTGDTNTAFGYQSGFNVSSGYGNLLLGASSTPNLTTGSNNIVIGNNTFATSSSMSNGLNIGGLVFGILPATSTSFKLPTSGAFGVATSSPYATLAVHANNGSTNTTLFAIGSSTQTATTTLFTVSNTGSTTIALLGSGMVASNNGLLYSTASSTMFGTGTGGQILTWNNGVPQWSATSTYTGSNGITTAFANNTLTITGTNAAADGSTKGVAAFTAADFNDNGSGLISIDYTNGQLANASQNGFLSSADWTTFNNKISSSSLASIFPFTPTTWGTSAANSTSTLIGFTSGIYATASSTIGSGTQAGGLTIWGGATTTGNTNMLGSLTINNSAATAPATKFTVYGSVATGATTTEEEFRITRPIAGGVSFPQTASFLLGSYAANSAANGFGPSSRLDLNMKAVASSAEAPDTNVMSFLANQTVGIASTSPFARLSVHAPNGVNNTTLFAIGSSTATATSTLFSVDNTGKIVQPGLVNAITQGSTVVTASISNLMQTTGVTWTTFLASGATNFQPYTKAGDAGVYTGNGRNYWVNRTMFDSAGEVGIGSTSPSALLSIMTPSAGLGWTGATTTLFAIGSTTNTATTTLFSINNTGTITTALTSGLVGNNSGTLYSFATSSLYGNVNANTVLANATGAAGTPSFVATSTFFGTGVGGQVLTWNNGVPQWSATSTYTGSNGITTTFANNTLTITGTNAAADGATKGVAAFTAADFNDNGSGLLSIDYANGQTASGSQNGFLSSADWNTFNNKISSSSLASIFPFTPTTAFGSAANATSTLIGFTNGIYATASSTIGGGTQAGGLTIWGGATTTGNAYVAGRMLIGGTLSDGSSLNVTGNARIAGVLKLSAGNPGFANVGSFTFSDTTGNLNYTTAGNGTQNNITFNQGGNVGVGTTSPTARLTVAATSTATNIPLLSLQTPTTLGLATTSVFTVDANGSTTIALLGSGIVGSNNGLLYSTASSTMFGTGTGGQVLTWNNGVPQWTATSTYTGSNGITTAFANNTLTITGTNAAADGSTKGVAAFTAADFNDAAGVISIDYANGQLATAGQNGFLSSTDWTNFNNKVSSSSLVTSIAAAYPFQLTGNATSTLTQFNGGLTAYASSTIGNGTQAGGLTISGGATTTGATFSYGKISIGNLLSGTNFSVYGGTSATNGNVYGSHFRTDKTSGSNSTVNVSTVYSQAYVNGTGDITAGGSLNAYLAGMIGGYAGQTTDLMTGYRVARPTFSSTGTTTNTRGIYIENLTSTSASGSQTNTPYGIYQEGSNNLNYFAGATGFGSSSPYAQLSVHAMNGSSTTTLFAIASSTQTATTTLFTIDNRGYVSVGTTSPSAYVSINPDSNIGSDNAFAIGSSTKNLFSISNAGNMIVGGTGQVGTGGAGNNFTVLGGTLRVVRTAVGDGSINVMSGGINLSSTGFLALFSNSTERARFLSTGQYGLGTTSPFALSSIHANNGDTNTTLFAIGSSTQTATTTLFTVSNTGTITTALTSGLVGNNSGTLYSFATSTLYGNVNANTVLANATGAAGTPSFVATSTFFGTGVGGQVLTWNNGVPQWTATSTYTGSNGITTAFANNTLTITGTNAAADGSTKGVAAFTAADFNDAAGVISIDYANGQLATAGQNGFLSSTDWTTFNNKVSSSSLISSIAAAFPFTPTAYGVSTSTLVGFTNGLLSVGSTTLVGNATTTGNMDIVGNLGVGTSTNLQKLHVLGSVALQMDATDATNAGYASIYGYKYVTATNSIRPEIRFGNLNNMKLFSGSAGAYPELTLINSAVGLGSSTPWAKLSINAGPGDSLAYPYLFAIGSSTATATTTLFAVTNTGNVGIGVANPSTQLQVAATSVSGEMTPLILQNISNANGAATSLGFSQNATLSGPLTGKISSIRNNASSFDIALYSSTGAGTVTEGLRLTSARNLGVGSTTPTAKLTVHAAGTDTNQYLFTIASSTATATTTLFTIDNQGNINTTLASGVIASNNGLLYSTASSTMFGTGTGGQVLTWNNGVPQWTATSTYTGSNGITTAFANNTLTITGTNAAADGSTKGVAAFTANDFDASSGVISLDYTNGQKANASQPGFLSSADWNIFNNKISSSSLASIFPFTPTTYAGSAVNATSTALWLTATTPFSLIASSTFATYASSTNLTTTGSTWLATAGGFVGVGTTTPYSKLSVWGANVASTTKIFEVTNYASTTNLSIDSGGFFSVGASNGTQPSNLFTVDATTGSTTIANLSIGNITFDTNAGIVTLADLPVDSNAALGVQQAQILSIANNPVLTVSGVSDGAGSVTNLSVGVGSTTPWAQLSINPDTNGSIPAFAIGSSTKTNFIVANTTGFTGVGTSTPWAQLSINPNGITGPAFAIGSSTKTLFSVSNAGAASTTQFFGSGLTSCTGGFVLTWSNGLFGCASDQTAAGAANPFFWSSTFNTIAAATTSAIWAQNGVFASSTSQFAAANVYGSLGVGTSTPWAQLSINPNGITGPAFAIGSSTKTLFSVSNAGAASTTQLFGAGLASCSGASNALTWSSGLFGCNSISGGASFPFTPTDYGVSTSTIVGFTNGLISAASSTFSGGLTVANGLDVSSSATITNPSISSNTNFLTLDASSINNVNQEERIFFQNGPTLPLGYMGVAEENPAGSYMAFGTVNTLSAAATEKLRISAVGNIGIGSTSPWAQLSINPNGITGPAFAIGSSTKTLFSVSTAGKVGINMSVPNANFQVHTTGNVATVAKLSNSVTGSGSQDGVDWALLPGGTDAQIWNYENGYLRFGTNNTEVGLFDSLGDFGIGSSSPFAKLSIASNNDGDESNPLFIIATSTGGEWTPSAQVPIFTVMATTTGSLDFARVAIGATSTWSGAAGLRDQFTVAGRIYSTWNYMSCDVPGNPGTANASSTSADVQGACGNFYFDAITDGAMIVNTKSYPPSLRISPGVGTNFVANEGGALRSWANNMPATSSPVMEVRANIPITTSTSTVYTIGFVDTVANAQNAGARPANGAFFEASSTNNFWYAVVRVNGNDISSVSTGIATTSTANLYRRFRVEMSSSTDTFLIDGTVVSLVTKTQAQLTPLAPVAQVARAKGALAAVVNTVAGTTAALDIASMRVWDDDPPIEMAGTGFDATLGGSAYEYDAISGASIAQTDIVGRAEDFVPGMIVANATSTFTDALGSTSPMVRRSVGSYDDDAFGVVALSPTLRFGQNTGAFNFVNVALAGRVHVLVSLENGQIVQGDRIAASSISGVGMKANRAGSVVGVAISGFATSSCDASLNQKLVDAGVVVPANACIGEVVVQLKAGQDLGIGSILQDATTTPFANFAAALGELTNTAFSKGAQFLKMVVGELVAKVAVIGDLFADTITVNNLIVGSQSQPAGITLFDQVTHQPYCFSIQSGQTVTTPGTCDHPTGPSQTSSAPSSNSNTSTQGSSASTSTPDTSVGTPTTDSTTSSTTTPDSTVTTSDPAVTISTPDTTPPPTDTAPAADTTVAPTQ